MSDIEEATREYSLIDLSDNKIEIETELVLISDFPEDRDSKSNDSRITYNFQYCVASFIIEYTCIMPRALTK